MGVKPAPWHDDFVCRTGSSYRPSLEYLQKEPSKPGIWQFLNYIDASVPAELVIHLVVDNYATHKHQRIRNRLAKRPRYPIHYTPTYSSWLHQVEIWFNIITQRAVRHSSFRSVKQLTEKINHFVENYNSHCQPFCWTATADSIIDKIRGLCEFISGTQQ